MHGVWVLRGQLFAALLAIGGVVILAFSGRYVRRATSIYRADPVSTLEGSSRGVLVRVSGMTGDGNADLLNAPFSGTGCLALRYAIEERRPSPSLLPWFVTIHELAGSDAFRVRTPEATVDVTEPARTVTLEQRVVATVPPGDEPPERIARFERTTGAVPVTTHWRSPPPILRPITTRLSLGTRWYTEQRATPGDDVTVVGRITETDNGVDPLVVVVAGAVQDLDRGVIVGETTFGKGLVQTVKEHRFLLVLRGADSDLLSAETAQDDDLGAMAERLLADAAARVRHCMEAAFAGRRIVVFSGGAKKGTEGVYDDTRAIRDGGGNGSIIGRNSFQRPRDEALDLFARLIDIYKGRD